MSITANIVQTLIVSETGNAGIYKLASGTASMPTMSTNYTDGGGAQQVSKSWSGYRTLTAGSNDDLDLSGSALLDKDGAAVVFAAVKEVIVAVVSPDGSKKVKLGNATNSFQGPLSSGATIDVFYCERWTKSDATGWTVTNSSNDILRINNPGGSSVSYFIVILGE